MKLSEVLNGIANVKEDIDITDVCYDSRAVRVGSLFVAIKGFVSDGHDFVRAAAENGAAAVLTEREITGLSLPQYTAADTRAALAQASASFFKNPQRELKMIAVTGTNGKTTVTNLIKQVLESVGHKCGLVGTNNNMIGAEVIPAERTTPESRDLFALLRRMADAGCEYAVMEVSSHSIALSRIRGIEFESGVFTNLTRDHLDFHKTMENYFAAKAQLFESCKTAVINIDDEWGRQLAKTVKCKTFTYSLGNNAADMSAENLVLKPAEVRFEAVMTGQIGRVILGIPGRFSAYNALAAASCCVACGLSLADAAAALRSASGVKGRAEAVPLPEGTEFSVIIDYAHTPDGMENILRTVRGFAQGRIISVFGAGGNRDNTKRPQMGKIGAELSDVCIITSDNPRKEEPMSIIAEVAAGAMNKKCRVVVVEDRRAAIARALGMAKRDDIVLLMGKGHETYQEISTGKIHLDEREEIAAFFGRR